MRIKDIYNKYKKILIFSIIGLYVFFTIKHINPGYVGIGSFFGKIQSKVYFEGTHLVPIFINIMPLSTDIRLTKLNIGLMTSDIDSIVQFELHVKYFFVAHKIPELLQNHGRTSIGKKVISSVMPDIVKKIEFKCALTNTEPDPKEISIFVFRELKNSINVIKIESVTMHNVKSNKNYNIRFNKRL
jgi:hypothetical protein